MKKSALFSLLLFLPCAADDCVWPEPAREAKPWTRWWWLGSGVDRENLGRELEAFAKAGIGGVEICPIYGAKGYEERDLPFLSDEWLVAYNHTVRQAARHRMGVDLTTGTGWPFGGPGVDEATGSASLEPVVATAEGGKEFVLTLPKGKVEVLDAWPDSGERVDLLGHIKDGRLVWQAPEGGWNIHGLVSRAPIQKVKRAAPGGEGWVVDPFSRAAAEAYLAPFSAALDKPGIPEPRAHFHDSFEYYNAAWTGGFFARFQSIKNYDLRDQLPAFQGRGDPETIARVRSDYREVMSHLHRDYLSAWQSWAKKRGSKTRNQAHGSPGNLLDHYAVADIPETEIFRQVGDEQIPMLQFASSAAHLGGKNLVSAETFTWLGEHFRVTPAKLKEAADFVWLGGVNHIFYHGIPYTPEDAGWPGWLFYASTHMGPNGGLWRNLPAFNAYIARCQTMLQSGEPDSELLLYYPVHDTWHDGGPGLPLFTVHNQDKWLHGTPFHRAAMAFWEAGVPCEFLTDSNLGAAMVRSGRIVIGKRAFKVIAVPSMRHMPDSTAWQLERIAKEGGKVVFLGELPSDVPGFHEVERRRSSLTELLKSFSPGEGDPVDIVAKAGVTVESDITRHGIRLVRRKLPDGHSWFLVNRSAKAIDEVVKPSGEATSFVLMDPWTGRSGVVDGSAGVRLVLAPGESRILRGFSGKRAEGPAWIDPEAAGEPIALAGEWRVEFIEGGPSLPEAFTANAPGSWVAREGDAYRSFSGTARYRLEFDLEKDFPAWLDLGEIAHTARVRLNGKDAGTCWAPPHRLDVRGLLKAGRNSLEVEVTNLAANRIADLDRRGVSWKAFHEINFVNIDYKPFDASGWEPMPSGLLGPVTLIPQR